MTHTTQTAPLGLLNDDDHELIMALISLKDKTWLTFYDQHNVHSINIAKLLAFLEEAKHWSATGNDSVQRIINKINTQCDLQTIKECQKTLNNLAGINMNELWCGEQDHIADQMEFAGQEKDQAVKSLQDAGYDQNKLDLFLELCNDLGKTAHINLKGSGINADDSFTITDFEIQHWCGEQKGMYVFEDGQSVWTDYVVVKEDES